MRKSSKNLTSRWPRLVDPNNQTPTIPLTIRFNFQRRSRLRRVWRQDGPACATAAVLTGRLRVAGVGRAGAPVQTL